MKYTFINTLSESKMFPSITDMSKFSINETNELIYIHLLYLSVSSVTTELKDDALRYAAKTIAYGNYNHYRNSGNDLYMLLHKSNNSAVQNNITKFLQKISSRTNSIETDQNLLLRLENDLHINSAPLKQLRREMLSNDIVDTIRKINRYLKSYTSKSDIIPILDRISPVSGLTMLQKAAVGVGVAIAGYHLGKALVHDPSLDKYRK